MEPLTLTEDQIVVTQFPNGNAGNQTSKTLTPNYIVANDDTDGTDSDEAGGGADGTDGTDGA